MLLVFKSNIVRLLGIWLLLYDTTLTKFGLSLCTLDGVMYRSRNQDFECRAIQMVKMEEGKKKKKEWEGIWNGGTGADQKIKNGGIGARTILAYKRYVISSKIETLTGVLHICLSTRRNLCYERKGKETVAFVLSIQYVLSSGNTSSSPSCSSVNSRKVSSRFYVYGDNSKVTFFRLCQRQIN